MAFIHEMTTFLSLKELWPKKLPTSFLFRAKQTLNFIDKIIFPACDLGENNPLKEIINTNIESIEIDLDHEKLNNQYQTILCFEVLEHLFNPLFALESMKNALLPNGFIYLSTPYQPHFIWGKHHFHEIDTKRLIWLFDKAGLKIVKQDKATVAGRWYQHINGIRPLIRYFQKTRLYQLSKT